MDLMKENGPWCDILLTVRLEKVQKVGSHSPTVAEVAEMVEALANGMVWKAVTILHKHFVQ